MGFIYIIYLGVVKGGGGGLHPYHIFIIGVVRGGLHPYHIIIIGVVRGGFHPYHIYITGIVRGGGFINIIYSE